MKVSSILASAILCLFCVVILCICSEKKTKVASIQEKADSLITVIGKLEEKIDLIEKEFPQLKVDSVNLSDLIIYEPKGLQIQIRHERPGFYCKNYLCFPAAYTTRTDKIDGFFIENGTLVNDIINTKLTGVCVITEEIITIGGYEMVHNDLINNTIKIKGCAFQQTLLVKSNEVFPCDLFGERMNKRRALVKIKEKAYLVESKGLVAINVFQQSLIEIGAIDAINLDMGSWSEGWFKDNCGNIVVVGENQNMSNTHRQTNWIICLKE